MNTQESVKKIKNKAKHYIDGNRIKAEKYPGMSKHIEKFVKGRYIVDFLGVFTPVPNHKDANALPAEEAYKSLEKAFDKLQYTEIRIIYGKSQRYNGNARVTFLDDRNKDKINKVAEKKFDHCRITTKEIKTQVHSLLLCYKNFGILDDRNKDKINKVAEKKFDHCRIATKEI